MTKETVEQTIQEIKKELLDFSIDKKNLEKFGTVDHMDDEYLSYVDGFKGAFYIKFLALLVKKIKPKNIVELGNREGLSTLAIYDQLPSDSKFVTIDILEDVRYCPSAMFNDARVNFITGDVCDIEILKEIPKEIDFLFSDTIHHDFQIRDEIEIYQHLLSDVALVAIDDIHTNDKGKFWDEVTYAKWDLSEICHSSGWGLYLFQRKNKTTPEQRWLAAVEASARIWRRKHSENESILSKIEEQKIQNKLKNFIRSNHFLHKTTLLLRNKK